MYTGYVPLSLASVDRPCKLWYKVAGDISLGYPLVTVGGGPGVSHHYLHSLEDLSRSGQPVVFWDQLGTGNSTHLPEKLFDSEFWTEELFIKQLRALLSHLNVENGYDILGHSWGGMLAAAFAAEQPGGLRRLVLSNVPFSSELYLKAYRGYRREMPPIHREVLMQRRTSLEATREPRYIEALALFLSRHLCRLDPPPKEFIIAQESLQADPTVWLSMLGPDEFTWDGSLKDWTMATRAHKISVPTLLLNGSNEGADDASQEEFLQALSDVRWVKFMDSTHMPHWEEREKYMQAVADFLEYTL